MHDDINVYLVNTLAVEVDDLINLPADLIQLFDELYEEISKTVVIYQGKFDAPRKWA